MQSLNRKLLPLLSLVTGLLVILIFYYGKPVLMPLALSGLFAFLLNPVVNFLHRRRLPRTVAVIIVTLSAFSIIGGIGWVLGSEFKGLAESLPRYRGHIVERIKSFHEAGKDGVVGKLTEMKQAIETATEPKEEMVTPTGKPKPMPVVIKGDESADSPVLGSTFLDSAGAILGTAATVIVFVIFLLLRQQELRDRIMRLVGFRHLTVATRGMDEAGERIGKYLLMQGMINCIYGLLLGVGLHFLGMPYPVLWGVMAALFRFIPYVGPLLAAILPGLVSLAVYGDWLGPVYVISLIAGLELLTNMVLEPVLYGQSVGVSDFSLLVSIAFWTWLWGPMGLVMATPLTVCLVVLAKYIPQLEWVEILMGDKPDVRSYMIYFQRLLAEDEEEAEDFIVRELKTKTPLQVADETMLPAIALAKRESRQERITEEEEGRIHEVSRRMMDRVRATTESERLDHTPASDDAPLVLGRALDGLADQNALELLDGLLPTAIKFEIVSHQRLNFEFYKEVEDREPSVILLSATPPGSHGSVRLHLRKLRSTYPDLRICVGRWGVPEDVANADALLEAGATAVFTTFAETEKMLMAWFGVQRDKPASPPSPVIEDPDQHAPPPMPAIV